MYVDKTDIIYDLVTTGKYYGFCRPRGFGKSLLLSTLKAYYEGKKELFKGLAIEELEKDWKEYPVLYLDLDVADYSNDKESLDAVLNNALTEWETTYEIEPSTPTFSLRFMDVIRRAYEKTGHKVVILVDEYNKPLFQTMDNKNLQEDIYDTLEPFYCALKSGDQYIRLGFLTGETDFVNTGWASGFNNLHYISTHYRYEDMCGITEDEIDTYFGEEVEKLARSIGLTTEETRLKLKEQYGGYHFSEKSSELYNPLSLLNALENKELRNYWTEKGTPEVLIKIIKESNRYDLEKLKESSLTSSYLNRPTAAPFNYPIPTMYATGYLTIREYDNEFWKYRLCIPNKEAEAGLEELLTLSGGG